MSILVALFSLLPLDLPCERHITLVLSDPDRQDVCPIDQAGPLFPWEVPPEGQRG